MSKKTNKIESNKYIVIEKKLIVINKNVKKVLRQIESSYFQT